MIKIISYVDKPQKQFLQFLILASIIIIHINALINLHYTFFVAGLILLLGVIFSRSWNALHYASLFFLMGLIKFTSFGVWRIPGMVTLIPLIASTLLIFLFPKARASLEWLSIGCIDNVSIGLIVSTTFIAACLLIAWGFLSNNLGIGLVSITAISSYPRWVILSLFIPAFALLNAFAEEALYRGVLQGTLSYIFYNKHLLAIVLQASAFAAVHVTDGFPNGKLGYVMTFLYGCILGYLRYRTKGIGASYLTHIGADFVIGYSLYFLASCY